MQIARKWIQDEAIDHTKFDSSDSYTIAPLTGTPLTVTSNQINPAIYAWNLIDNGTGIRCSAYNGLAATLDNSSALQPTLYVNNSGVNGTIIEATSFQKGVIAIKATSTGPDGTAISAEGLIKLVGLPTSDPGTPGLLFRDGSNLCISI